ncbi:HK97 gp10 family phage protein [Candidatus Saccharibacteria bacterium]|nr:HK97 gp10 family phage protein [Candidatus Saccharibacteria bacterium]
MKKSLKKQMDAILDASLKNVKVTTDQAARVCASQSTAALRAVSPRRPGGGDYARGWTMERIRGGLAGSEGWRVKNEDHYELTHLLENGHAKVNGGRVRARVHISPVEQKGIATFLQLIKSRI